MEGLIAIAPVLRVDPETPVGSLQHGEAGFPEERPRPVRVTEEAIIQSEPGPLEERSHKFEVRPQSGHGPAAGTHPGSGGLCGGLDRHVAGGGVDADGQNALAIPTFKHKFGALVGEGVGGDPARFGVIDGDEFVATVDELKGGAVMGIGDVEPLFAG
jgi:hypothetical protein